MNSCTSPSDSSDKKTAEVEKKEQVIDKITEKAKSKPNSFLTKEDSLAMSKAAVVDSLIDSTKVTSRPSKPASKKENYKRPEAPKAKEKLIDPKLIETNKSLKNRGDKKPEFLATMEIFNPDFNFGNVSQGDTVYHDYEFINRGNQDLVISAINTTCGCTVPDYPKGPIPPGKVERVHIMYLSAGKIGLQSGRITITANTLPKENYITLKGIVR